MAEHMPGDPDAGDRLVRLDDGDMHVVQDGKPGAPALLLIQNAAVPTACWDPVVPRLAGAYRVIRVDLLGHGRSASPADGYDIPAHARRVGAVLDMLGVSRVTVIGHSSGCTVATALAEQRPDAVAGLALIDMGPSPGAKIPERLLTRLLLTQFPGRLLWRLKSETNIRKAARTGFTRPVDIPDAFIEHVLGMTHRAFVGAMRAPELPGAGAACAITNLDLCPAVDTAGAPQLDAYRGITHADPVLLSRRPLRTTMPTRDRRNVPV
jgi:pimeloyl-ACP methyl ester carboxylesterase